MIIFCDVDGVCADLHTAWLSLYNRDYKDELGIEQITEWDMTKFVMRDCGVKIYEYLKDPTIYKGVYPIFGSQEGVYAIRDMGYRVVFLTAGIYRAKYDWLIDNKFISSERDVIVAQDKSLVNREGNLLIDDYTENLKGWDNQILYLQPWNENIKDSVGLKARHWQDVVKFVRSYEST